MSISAQDVQKLRSACSVGMMEAKNALTESEGDFISLSESSFVFLAFLKVNIKKGMKDIINNTLSDKRSCQFGANIAPNINNKATNIIIEMSAHNKPLEIPNAFALL